MTEKKIKFVYPAPVNQRASTCRKFCPWEALQVMKLLSLQLQTHFSIWICNAEPDALWTISLHCPVASWSILPVEKVAEGEEKSDLLQICWSFFLHRPATALHLGSYGSFQQQLDPFQLLSTVLEPASSHFLRGLSPSPVGVLSQPRRYQQRQANTLPSKVWNLAPPCFSKFHTWYQLFLLWPSPSMVPSTFS